MSRGQGDTMNRFGRRTLICMAIIAVVAIIWNVF
jgi:hypothetical protein